MDYEFSRNGYYATNGSYIRKRRFIFNESENYGAFENSMVSSE
jgi:hypothetical protein